VSINTVTIGDVIPKASRISPTVRGRRIAAGHAMSANNEAASPLGRIAAVLLFWTWEETGL
jgi:hypothetical protein